LSEDPTQPPVTGNRIQRRSAASKRRVTLLLVVIPVVAVAIGAVAILAFGGGDGGGVPFLGDGDEPVPEFDFRVSPKVAVITTSEGSDAAALRTAADDASAEVTPILDELYTSAFLDPGSWRDGDYEDVFAHFADGAVAAAQENVEALTLGATAGDVFERVSPERGSLAYQVLFDPEGTPDTVVVRVRFRALGERTDGTFLAIVSDGQFFFRNVDGWKVTAFEVERADREAPAPTPAPSASPSA
jgi:hypothetical protein